jgi:AcrR family transcriptional regulator
MMSASRNATPPASAARERILLTAHDLFYREGIRATGIDRVIAESGVTKVTFYRHFPSKHDLILAYLDHRHRRWMEWFAGALARHGHGVAALVPAMAEWFRSQDYRGCAFINSVVELGGTLPEIAKVARRHKREMTAVIASHLSPSPHMAQDAQALAVAVDGAIIRAQAGPSPDEALEALERLVKGLVPQRTRRRVSKARR